jgi:two-component system, chemotaxis family, chemotaxis protein CheY
MSIKDILQVMVIDDHVTSRMLTVEMLQDFGIRNIHVAKDGRDAFNKLNAQPVHLIISDMYMPDIDGMKLLQVLRSHARFAKTGFIMMTGRKDATITQNARALGVNNVLEKPVTAPGLRQAVEAVVGRIA